MVVVGLVTVPELVREVCSCACAEELVCTAGSQSQPHPGQTTPHTLRRWRPCLQGNAFHLAEDLIRRDVQYRGDLTL